VIGARRLEDALRHATEAEAEAEAEEEFMPILNL
jgi:hypothetical protein